MFAPVPAKAQTTVWSGTLTVHAISNDLGCRNVLPESACSLTSVLTDDDFTHGGVDYAIRNLFVRGHFIALGLDKAVPSDLQSRAVLNVGSEQFSFSDDAATTDTATVRWDNSGLSWSLGDTVSLSIVLLAKPTVSLSVSPNPVLEGSSATVTITLSRALSSQVTIPVTLTNDDAETGDYGTLSSITINSGSTSGTGTISTNHDTDEDDETFTVALDTANLPSEVTAGTQSSVQITIRDDEGIPTVSLSADPNPVPEGENVTVTATLSEALSHYVQIPLLPAWNTGTVEQGDIKGPPGTITVHSGSTTGETLVLAVRDCDTEDEEFIVEINTATLPSSLRADTQSSVTVRITDDGTEWCRSQPPSNTGGTTGGGGGGGLPTPGSDDEPPPQDEEPQTSCPREDREILGSFYEMTDGESWHEKENWNSEEPLDQWHGVETDDPGEVVSLRLPDNNLSGDMPTEKLLCLELKELALWGNDDLSGEVPEELVLAVERAVLRDIAEMLNINPEWFENYGDPYDFEGWYTGVTTDDEGRVTGLDLTGEGVIGEIPQSVSELRRLRDIMITTREGGCAVGGSSAHMKASALLAVILMLLAVSRGLRARSD